VRVADIMTSASVTESPSDSLRAAAEKMWRQQTGSLIVMEADGLVGIVTERDVMKAVATGHDVATTPVSDIMTRDVLTISPGTSLHEAARHMVGVVSQRDLVGVFAALASDTEGAALPNEELVREQRLARIEHGDLD
jgi:CBS domain-containing protein